jgi:hypothetical protein
LPVEDFLFSAGVSILPRMGRCKMGYDGIHALNNTATQFASHPSTLAASGLPIAATFGFVPGLMMGLKKG